MRLYLEPGPNAADLTLDFHLFICSNWENQMSKPKTQILSTSHAFREKGEQIVYHVPLATRLSKIQRQFFSVGVIIAPVVLNSSIWQMVYHDYGQSTKEVESFANIDALLDTMDGLDLPDLKPIVTKMKKVLSRQSFVDNSNSSYNAMAFNDPTFHDVEFHFENPDRLLYGHRLLLSSRCPYFYQMFTCGLKESHDVIVKIQMTEVDYDTVCLMLQYLYTGRLDLHARAHDIVAQVYKVMDHYLLFENKPLKEYCLLHYQLALSPVTFLERFVDDPAFGDLMQVLWTYVNRSKKTLAASSAFREQLKQRAEAHPDPLMITLFLAML